MQLGDALAGRGHDVELLAAAGNELERRNGAAHMRALLTPPVRSAEQPASRLAYLIRRAGVAVRLARAWARILWESRTGRYDVVVLNMDVALSLAAASALLLTALPGRPRIAFVCHNARPFNTQSGTDMFQASSLAHRLLARLYTRLDLIFLHGERSRSEFEATWPPARLAIVPHGDERLFAGKPPPPAREERGLFFGDWRKVKGLEELMAAFDELAARRPTARLTIAGTPAPADTDPEVVRRWAARHGERVRVIDRYVPMEQVRDVFAEARALVAPYRVAFQSGVVHLAMTMARAVVATDVGDLPSAVRDRETGRIVPPGDTSALAAALEEVLADPELAERYGREGRRRVMAGSSWEQVAERFDEALAALPPRRGS